VCARSTHSSSVRSSGASASTQGGASAHNATLLRVRGLKPFNTVSLALVVFRCRVEKQHFTITYITHDDETKANQTHIAMMSSFDRVHVYAMIYLCGILSMDLVYDLPIFLGRTSPELIAHAHLHYREVMPHPLATIFFPICIVVIALGVGMQAYRRHEPM